MKKFAISLIACLAIVQSTYAATSALTESLNEYEAITNAIGRDPKFENIIGPSEFIVDIARKTHQIDVVGTIKYRILTQEVTADIVGEELLAGHSNNHHSHKNKNKGRVVTTYIATLEVTRNPGVGPNFVKVVSIKKVRSQTHTFFDDDLSTELETQALD